MKVFLLLASLALPSVAFADGPFVDLDFDAARKEAKASDRVVFIDFYTTWCGPCKKLDVTTWKDEAVVEWLTKNTVALKIDAEKQASLAKRYKVTSYPTMVFVEADGTLRGSIVGYRDPKGFFASAKDAMAGIKPSQRLREELAKDPTDPSVMKKLASALVREGNNEEALELFLKCWDHGDEPPHQSFSGVRVSFLLSDLKRLAKTYPPARAALVERRDSAKKIVLGVSPTRAATKDFIKLNDGLGDTPMTLEVYDQVVKNSEASGREGDAKLSQARQQLFKEVAPMMVKAGRYDEVVAEFGDPQMWMQKEVASFEMMVRVLKSSERPVDDALDYRRKSIVKKASLLYLALLGAKNNDTIAMEFGLAVVDFSPAASTWQTLMENAEKVGRKDIATDLLARAELVLPEDELAKLTSKEEK